MKRVVTQNNLQALGFMADTGKMSHNVDLKDHLGGALNNLRFSESCWESEFMTRSGFYTNRMQHRDMATCFASTGFKLLHDNVGRWNELPTPVDSMDGMFQDAPEKELRICSFSIILCHAE